MIKNKAILLMNTTSAVGGAQKRYLNLFNYISIRRDDYFLIINKLLYDEFKENNLLVSNKNIRIIDLGFQPVNSEKSLIHSKLNVKILNKTTSRLCGIKKIVWLLRKFKIWLLFSLKFRKIQKKENIGIIYSIWIGGIWVWSLKYLFKFKLIHSYNDSSLSSLSKNIFRIFDSEYWVLKNCDKIDFLSEGIISRLEKIIGKIDDNKKLITPNSFISYDNYYPRYPKENNIIFLSRLIDLKNPILFLKAILIFNKIYNLSDINFYILGIGPLESSIKSIIKKHKLTNTHYIGVVYKPWEYLRTSKIFISIQQEENYPSQSVLEAMACENAIIASDVGETRKLVTENEGILVDLNASEIADAIYRLISNKKLSETLGKNARKKALSEHNIEKYAKYFYSITE